MATDLDFTDKICAVLTCKVAQLQAALDNEREYTVSEEHDPSLLLFQGTHQLGVATLFMEPIVYMMATEVCMTLLCGFFEAPRGGGNFAPVCTEASSTIEHGDIKSLKLTNEWV